MENRNNRDTLCDRCGTYYIGLKGLRIHRSRPTKCNRLQLQNRLANVLNPPNNVPDVPTVPNPPNNVPGVPNGQGGPQDINVIHIEGYSLNYLTVPADLLPNLDNEQLVDGRYRSLIRFSENATEEQRRKQMGPFAWVARSVDFISSSVFWGARLYGIASMGYAFYYTYIGECSTAVNYFYITAKKKFE
ncbi:hypothetical protein HPULCUR_002223 [Helicostylum pulchrum]|uniref:Uncharacterized protein n=1 Tax=Helicostylum pulchrum TaxID=562976 RepID=A0ABP9XPY6_9FUNG